MPLTRRGLPLSALVIGSMAPDIPYFVLPSGQSEFSHCWQGMLTLSLPLGIVALWLFHSVLKWPLLSLFPDSQRTRLTSVASGFTWNGWRGFFVIALNILVGGFTHYVWDGLTHYYGWEGVARFTNWSRLAQSLGGNFDNIPNFRTVTFPTPLGRLFIFDILQYSSSLLGMVLLSFWYQRWLHEIPESPAEEPFSHTEPLRRISLTLMAILFCVGLFWNGFQGYSNGWPLYATGWIQGFIRQSAISSSKFALIGLLIHCLAWHWIFGRSRSTSNLQPSKPSVR